MLAQSALPPSDMTIERIAIAVAAVALMAFWRDMRAFRDESRTWQTRVETALFGANGNNGIHGTVKAIVEELKQVVHRNE